MNNAELKPCPFCGGKAELIKYHESTDGNHDIRAHIRCSCHTKMFLTLAEYSKVEKDFGYTGGYYSSNKKFWEGMHQRLVDKWNARSSGWIPCSERLPELETDVFICTKQNGIAIASLSKPDIFWTDEEGFHILDVIAWQPLPAHYQPENS